MTNTIALEGGTYRITNLIDDRGMIRNLTATDVTFIGPAIIAPVGNIHFDSPVFASDGGPEAIFWEIDPARQTVSGVVGLDNCNFVRCTFANIGYAAGPDQIKQLWTKTEVNP